MGVLFQLALKEIGYECTSCLNTDKIHKINDIHINCDVYIGEISDFESSKIMFYHNGVEMTGHTNHFFDPMIRVYSGTELIYESYRVSSKIFVHQSEKSSD